MTERRVGIVYSSREWRRPLQQHVRNHVAGLRLLLLRDERSLLDEPLDAVIVDDETSFLSPDVVESLRSRGVRLIGVHDGTAGSRQRLAALGIDVTVASDAAPAEFVEAIEKLDGRMASDFARLAAQFEDDDDAELGSVVAVGGPPGAGKTEVAVALADQLARIAPTLLVDADEMHPSVARRLHLGLHPHLLVAIDEARSAMAAAGGAPVVAGSLAKSAAGADRPAPPFDVICGLANPSDWQVVRSDDLRALLRRVVLSWRHVVCDTSGHLEDLVRVDRWPLSRGAIAGADRVVGVCTGTPDGVLRFLDWLVDASSLVLAGVDVVVNRAPRGEYVRAEIEAQIRDNSADRVASVTFVPDDPKVARAAWDGHLLGRAKFSKALVPTVHAVLAPPMAVAF